MIENKNQSRFIKAAVLMIFSLAISKVSGQIEFGVSGTVNKRISSGLSEGTNVEVKQLVKRDFGSNVAIVRYNGKLDTINIASLEKITFNPGSSKSFWQTQCIINKSLRRITHFCAHNNRSMWPADCLQSLVALERCMSSVVSELFTPCTHVWGLVSGALMCDPLLRLQCSWPWPETTYQ